MTIVAEAGVAFYKCYIHPSIYSRLEEWSHAPTGEDNPNSDHATKGGYFYRHWPQ